MENKKLKIYGCILGAFIGDALGCTLEFKININNDQIEKCWKMPGGGPFFLKPGQITDDSELAICLLLGILEGKGDFNLGYIRKNYVKWFKSNPLDIGNTTIKAITILKQDNFSNKNCLDKVYSENKNSQSNGGLMKITPLSCYFHNLNRNNYIKNIVNITLLEQGLSHPNKTSIEVSIIYNIAIYNLLNNLSVEETFEEIRKYLKTIKNEEIKEWWNLIEIDKPYNSYSIGHVKIAFTQSFYLLKHKYTVYDGFKNLLKIGGDTDTNLAIAGGLLGSYHGYNKINKDWIERVLNCEPKREDFLVPKKLNLLNLIDELIKISPKENIKIII